MEQKPTRMDGRYTSLERQVYLITRLQQVGPVFARTFTITYRGLGWGKVSIARELGRHWVGLPRPSHAVAHEEVATREKMRRTKSTSLPVYREMFFLIIGMSTNSRKMKNVNNLLVWRLI